MLMNSNYTMEKYFQSAENRETCQNDFLISSNIEYKGYYKFGSVLGRGRFGTVIECLRKCDNKPIAIKFFKLTGIYIHVLNNLQIVPSIYPFKFEKNMFL